MIIDIQAVPDRIGSNYPSAALKQLMEGRTKKRLGDAAGLKNFGVNWVKLEPNSRSALRHWHSLQDEFIYVLEGELMLVTNEGEQLLKPGMAAGFPAGEANGHHLINRSDRPAIYLEVGDRSIGDQVTYPDDDLIAKATPQGWAMTRKDGSPVD